MADTRAEEASKPGRRSARNGNAKSEATTFQFITTTEQPQSINESVEISRTVRSHAMQSFLHRKNVPVAASAPVTQTPPAVSAKPGKFKLSTWSRKPRSKTGKTKENQEKSSGSKEIIVRPNNPVASASSLNIKNSQLNYLGSLPIPQGGAVKNLVNHYVTRYKMNIFSMNYNGSWLSFSFSDPAILNATLYCVAQHRDLLCRTPNSSDALLYKGETMRIVNDRLLHQREHLSDGTIASVAVLNNWESKSGSFEASKAHVDGLANMVRMRGGLSAFKGIVFNLLAYSDTLYCTRWSSALKFLIHSSSQNVSVEPILARRSSDLVLRTRTQDDITTTSSSPENQIHQDLQPSNHSQTLENTTHPQSTPQPLQSIDQILQTIRSITQSITLPNLTTPEKKTISDLIYSTEYLILTWSYAREHQSHNEKREEVLTSVSEAFPVAAMLYLELMIREIPTFAKAFHRLLLKLLAFLDACMMKDSNGALEDDDLFVWIVFIAASTASFPVLERYLPSLYDIEHGRRNDEDGRKEFKRRLERVVWREEICDEYLTKAWNARKG